MKQKAVFAAVIAVLACTLLVTVGCNGNNNSSVKEGSKGQTVTVSPMPTPTENQATVTSPKPIITNSLQPEILPTSTPTAYCNGIDPGKPIVALSFDDGPSNNGSTERILKTLTDYSSSATFFVVGSMAKANPNTLLAIEEAGCEIGNHSYSHELRFMEATQQQIDEDIQKADDVITEITGNSVYLVRPPWGSYNEKMLSCAKRPYIFWSIDTEDWKTRDKYMVFAKVKDNIKDGYIILMHDIYQSTADAVELIVPWLIEHGYQVVSVSKLFAARNIIIQPGYPYRMALTNGETYQD